MRGRSGEGAGGRWGAQEVEAPRRWGERGRRAAGARALAGARTRADAQAGVERADMGGHAGGRGARGSRTMSRRAGLAGRWALGLALGCALGALGLFLARFDSVFS